MGRERRAQADSFLETSALELVARALAAQESPAALRTDFLDRLRTGLAIRYRIEGELGHGGMARVYLARDLKHERFVAIKVLRPEVAASIGAARFLREIGIASRLSHPHILPLHDSGEADGLLYYVMPYLPGDSLRARLERDRRLALDDALQVTREVADALTYAHGTGIVHRDIKPENILFAAGHALVTDFGIARAISLAAGEQITETGIAIGTPAYMSPEQATGSEQVDGRSDVYSLGCVLYEMLSGEPPFTGSSAQAILAAHLSTVPRDMAGLGQGVPSSVAQAVARMLAKEPAARFDALELQDAIAPLAADAGRLASASASRWRNWRRRALAAAGGVMAIVVVAIAMRSVQKREAPERSLAVMPFTMLGASAELPPSQLPSWFLQRLGSVPDLRIVPPITVASWTGAQAPVISEAESMAVQLNATYFVEPSLELQGKRASLGAQVYDTRSGKLLATGRQEGSSDSLSYLMDAVWAQVLPAILRRNFAPVSSVTLPHGLAALLAYASAEEAFWRGDYAGALDDYNNVIAADSTFALAYFRRALVIAQVDPREESMRGAIAGAQRHQSGLTAADSLLLDGYHLLLDHGDGRGALQSFRAAADLAPDAPQTWFVLGEFYFHYGAIFDQSLSDAEDAFNRVRSLTPSSAPAIAHLIALAHLRGDNHATAELIAEYEAFNTQSVVAEAVGIADTLLVRGLPSRAALLKTLDHHSFTALEYLAFQAQQVGTDAERAGPARAVLRALERRATTDSQQVLALRLGVGADLGEGWTDSARARLARVHTPATERERDRWLVLLAAVGLDSLGGWRDAADRLARSPQSGEMEHWMLARLGRDRARHVAALERLAADSAPLPMSLKLDLDARRALLAGDTVHALRLWQQATQRYAVLRVPFGLVASLWWLRLDMAGVAAAHGDTTLARRTCDSFGSLIGYADLIVQPKSKAFCALALVKTA